MKIAVIRNGNVATPSAAAADDEAAREQAKAFARESGPVPVDAGPLKNARYLKPLGFLNIRFGYLLGQGADRAATTGRLTL